MRKKNRNCSPLQRSARIKHAVLDSFKGCSEPSIRKALKDWEIVLDKEAEEASRSGDPIQSLEDPEVFEKVVDLHRAEIFHRSSKKNETVALLKVQTKFHALLEALAAKYGINLGNDSGIIVDFWNAALRKRAGE